MKENACNYERKVNVLLAGTFLVTISYILVCVYISSSPCLQIYAGLVT